MKKMYYFMAISILILLLLSLYFNYQFYRNYNNLPADIFKKQLVSDLFMLTFIVISLILALKENILSAIMGIVFSLNTFFNIGYFFAMPIMIYKYISMANYQFGLTLLFNLATFLLAGIILTLWVKNKVKQV